MQSIEMLMREHRNIERVVDALEIAAGHLSRGVAVRPGFFVDAAVFFAEYADGVHHAKEEGVLFGAMGGSGMPAAEGPIPVMLEEHVEARALTRALRRAGRRFADGDTTASSEVITASRGYALLIREHIAKEDEALFPMAEEMLSADAESEVLQGMMRLEAQETGSGRMAELLALADTLSREAAALSQK